jgi:hypothetical protein
MRFTYEPESFTWRLVWETDIVRPRSGVEQRAAIVRMPRHEFDAEYVLDLEDLREVRSGLHAGAESTHQLPMWSHEAPVIEFDGSGNVVIDSLHSEAFPVGRSVLIRDEEFGDFVGEITDSEFDGGTVVLTLDPEVGSAYHKPDVLVTPLVDVYVHDDLTTGRWRLNDIGRFDLKAVSQAYFETMGFGADALPTFDGYYLLDVPPSIDDDEVLTEQHRADVTGMDGAGVLKPVTGIARGDVVRQAKFAWHTPADRQFWLKFLWAVEGRRVPFLTPTWRPDLDLTHAQTADTDELDVAASPDFRTWWTLVPSRRYLAVMFEDGTFEAAEVTAVTDNLDNTHTLTLAATLTTGGPIAYLSLLEVVRLASDVVEVTCLHGRGHFNLPLVAVAV